MGLTHAFSPYSCYTSVYKEYLVYLYSLSN
nr:MAG TPA: hypothetical protein [Caudoviricetes sp.]